MRTRKELARHLNSKHLQVNDIVFYLDVHTILVLQTNESLNTWYYLNLSTSWEGLHFNLHPSAYCVFRHGKKIFGDKWVGDGDV